MEKKARIVLAPEVNDMIEHLTRNLTTEISAFGTVKIKSENKEKYFYVDKLFFPEQEVSGASVKLRSNSYKKLFKEASLEELGRLNFYWHRHPGSASHSHIDEEETFGALMGKEDKRKYFIFMQTAKKYNDNKLDVESRIDIRTPVRATILNDEIEVLWEHNKDEEEILNEIENLKEKMSKLREKKQESLKEKAKKIIDESVIKERFRKRFSMDVSKNSGFKFSDKNKSQTKLGRFLFKGVSERIKEKLENSFTIEYEKSRISNRKYTNDPKKEVFIQLNNGNIDITFGEKFEPYLDKGLKKNGFLSNFVVKKKTLMDIYPTKKVRLQPKKKKFLTLKVAVLSLFLVYNEKIFKDYCDTKNKNSKLVVNSPSGMEKTLDFLYGKYCVEWENKKTMVISNDQREIGRMNVSDDSVSLETSDKDLIQVLTPVTANLRLNNDVQLVCTDNSKSAYIPRDIDYGFCGDNWYNEWYK